MSEYSTGGQPSPVMHRVAGHGDHVLSVNPDGRTTLSPFDKEHAEIIEYGADVPKEVLGLGSNIIAARELKKLYGDNENEAMPFAVAKQSGLVTMPITEMDTNIAGEDTSQYVDALTQQTQEQFRDAA